MRYVPSIIFSFTCWVIASAGVHAQPVVPACQEACAFGDAACAARVADCQAKFMAYDAYLTQMGLGVPMFTLPPLYQEILAPLYPNANLAEVQYGYSNRQPPNNATADCDRIYFNNSQMVNDIQNAQVSDPSRWHWLFHELRHFEQCREVGSRDAFAKMWWDDLSATELSALIESGNWTAVHDQMAMEGNADARADANLDAVDSCCRHPETGILIRPLAVSEMGVSISTAPYQYAGATVMATVSASDGAQPLAYEWALQRPGMSGYQALPSGSDDVTFTADEEGSYHLRVRVRQAGGSSWGMHEEVRPLYFSENPEPTDPYRVDLKYLHMKDVLHARLLLDRPPPVPVTLVLENSRADLLEMPRTITFRRGQTELEIPVKLSGSVRSATDVRIRVHNARDVQQKRVHEAKVEVLPPQRRGRG